MTETNNTSLFTVEAVGESEFKQLEPGAYPATCVAAVVKNFKKYKSETEVEPKCVFTFQIADDDDVLHYVRTQPMKLIAGDSSAFGKMVASWLKLAAPNLVGWNASNLLGKCAQVVVNIEQKGDKSYTRVESVLPAKKSQKDGAIADAIPAFIINGALQYMLAEGITIKQDEPEDKVTEVNLTVPKKSAAQAQIEAADSEDDMPF